MSEHSAVRGLEPSIALAAYAEPLLTGKRALVFGDALSPLAEQLLARGARLVHVCDADPLRIAQASARNGSPQLSFSPLADGDLAVREASFEIVLIENLGAFDALSVLRKARRALTSRGALLAAAPNPDIGSPLLPASDRRATALDYYALYDAVAAEFQHVRMLGQAPFVGYAIVDFSVSHDPEPALDTGFVPSGAEEPDIFLALGSMYELALDDYAVIQLPTRPLLEAAGQSGGDAELLEARAAERRARVRIAELEAAQRKRPEAAGGQAREIERLNHWISELEGRAATADERADQAEAELEDTRARAEMEFSELKTKHEAVELALAAARAELAAARTELGRQAQELSKQGQELARQAQELAKHGQELEQRTSELKQRERELKTAEARSHELTAGSEQGIAEELSGAERLLQERGTEVRRLEHELRAAERTGRELVRELARRSPPSADPRLVEALAERDADLQAAAWTIDSLSAQLAESPSSSVSDEGAR